MDIHNASVKTEKYNLQPYESLGRGNKIWGREPGSTIVYSRDVSGAEYQALKVQYQERQAEREYELSQLPEYEPPVSQSRQKENVDLAVCPDEIRALDPNADVLWVVFIRRTGIQTSAARKRKVSAKDFWVDNNSRRAAIIRGFGLPSLIQRLSVAKTELERARIWWRESAACAEGDTIPDLSAENLHVLNPFIVTKELKFTPPVKTTKADWLHGAEEMQQNISEARSSSEDRHLNRRTKQSLAMKARWSAKRSAGLKNASVGN